jgi:monoterpene epsilon-lactone hydrolase
VAKEHERIICIGDSAGGNLVAGLLLKLRDGGERLPQGAVLISAVLDLALTGASVTERAAREAIILPESLRACASAYGGKTDPRRPMLSPLYGDLAGLPRLLVQVGSEEMLRDDSVRFADKARAAGVDVTLEEWPDMIHVWHLFADRLAEARAALARIGEFVTSLRCAPPTR